MKSGNDVSGGTWNAFGHVPATTTSQTPAETSAFLYSYHTLFFLDCYLIIITTPSICVGAAASSVT